MSHFQVDIYETKPVAVHVLRGQVDLHSGKSIVQEVQANDDLVFERIHQTLKSKLTFRAAERKEGIFYFYFIAFDNTHSYLYIIGETNERPLIRGGAFIEVDAEDSKDVGTIVGQYIEDNAKVWAKLYAKDPSQLIGELNGAVAEVLDLIP